MPGDVIKVEEKDRQKMDDIGFNTDEAGRSGSFLMENDKVHHVSMKQEGVEMLSIKDALIKYPELNERMWKLVDRIRTNTQKTLMKTPSPAIS